MVIKCSLPFFKYILKIIIGSISCASSVFLCVCVCVCVCVRERERERERERDIVNCSSLSSLMKYTCYLLMHIGSIFSRYSEKI